MEDCYRILGIPKQATVAEIKRAFRKKAKELHPDVLGKWEARKETAFHKLVKAYEILSDALLRSQFDIVYEARFKRKSTEDSFDYRDWLDTRTDEESRCKLLFFDLLHDREDDAVNEYKKLAASRAGFSLSRWFTREQFMDCAFILAEELDARGEFYDAYKLLSSIIRLEYTFSYFRHFFPEVLAFTRTILRTKIRGIIPDELALDAWEDALELDFDKKDNALFLRYIAETYEKMGDADTAHEYFHKALHLNPQVLPLKMRKRYESL